MAKGIKPLSLSDAKGLCSKSRRCVKRDGHKGKCWPLEVKTK